MHLNPPRIAATEPVQRAIATLRGGAAWQLFLDKLSFERDSGGGDEPAKSRALRDVCAIYKSPSAQAAMATACQSRLRWLDALERQIGPARFRRITLVNDSRLLLHLGRASVLENVGLYCDRTTGLPIIPGTALKGVLSTWACWCENESALAPDPPKLDIHRTNDAQRIFGDNSDSGSEHAGGLVFLGGFPAHPPKLGLDIVNPHHESNGAAKLNLTPNVFLALEAGTEWQFAFFARSACGDGKALLDTAQRWLIECLTQLGLGAKTAAGYGRFRPVQESPRPVLPPEKPKSAAQLEVELVAILKNSFTWDNKLKSHIAALQAEGDETALEKIRALAAEHLDKNKLGQLRLKPWFPK